MSVSDYAALQTPAPCNCLVMWDPIRETHVWLNGSFDGACGHPASGEEWKP